MAKVELVNKHSIVNAKTLANMEVGDIGEVVKSSGDYWNGLLVFKSPTRVVSLSGNWEWTIEGGSSTLVRILDKGEQIILTQER